MAVALRQRAKREKLSKKRYGAEQSAPLDLGMNEEYYQEVAEALEVEEDDEGLKELTPSQYMLSDEE